MHVQFYNVMKWVYRKICENIDEIIYRAIASINETIIYLHLTPCCYKQIM